MRKLSGTGPQSLALMLVLSAWSPAQAAPAAAPAAPATALAAVPAEPEVSVVTVLGRMPKRLPAEVRGLSRSSASSCAYDSWGARDEVLDRYFDGIRGGDSEYDGIESELLDDSARTRRFEDNSPLGDARRSGPSTGVIDADGRSNPCTRSAYTSAAGRNYIARKDKTLDQAYAAYDARDFKLALATFRTSYNRIGWDEAALMLGAMYEAGQGTARDPKEAIAWYTKLAEAKTVQEHYSVFNPAAPEQPTSRIDAQLRLAQLYMAGAEGVPRDPARARYWYQQAAKLDYAPAHFTLGRMFENGYGGAKDPAGAAKMYTAAAEVGYAPAQVALAGMYESGQGVAKDPQKAFAWYQQAALHALAGRHKAQAQFAVAEAYDQGAGVPANPTRALTFYKLAAVSGQPAAQNALATYFYNGQLVTKDLAVARKLFLAAASQGQDGAMVNVAAMLYRGEGGAKDQVQALAWLKLGGKLGNEDAAKGAIAMEKSLTPEERARADAVVKGGK